jgi:hypothetical protein
VEWLKVKALNSSLSAAKQQQQKKTLKKILKGRLAVWLE